MLFPTSSDNLLLLTSSVLLAPRLLDLHISFGPEVTQIPDRQRDAQAHLCRHDDKGHVPAQQADDEQQRAAGLLQFHGGRVVAGADLPVGAGQDPGAEGDEEEDEGEDGVGLEGEDPEGEEREAPHDQVDGDDGVVFFGGDAGGVAAGRRVRGSEAQGRELQHAEGEPEDREEAHDHHREEVAHQPLEDQGEREQ